MNIHLSMFEGPCWPAMGATGGILQVEKYKLDVEILELDLMLDLIRMWRVI